MKKQVIIILSVLACAVKARHSGIRVTVEYKGQSVRGAFEAGEKSLLLVCGKLGKHPVGHIVFFGLLTRAEAYTGECIRVKVGYNAAQTLLSAV